MNDDLGLTSADFQPIFPTATTDAAGLDLLKNQERTALVAAGVEKVRSVQVETDNTS